ncbi:hypothetical protein [Streptomyces fumanus]|uniref:hypothetical protein n=1 Tax=Streptomyces fumanus TaxID=67302 RepID=UPI00167DC88D|nr:hypothetical protein [Streptomyces fumanus]
MVVLASAGGARGTRPGRRPSPYTSRRREAAAGPGRPGAVPPFVRSVEPDRCAPDTPRRRAVVRVTVRTLDGAAVAPGGQRGERGG